MKIKNSIDELLAEATEYIIKNDRNLFRPFLVNACLVASRTPGVQLTGINASRLILGDSSTSLDSFRLTFMAADPEKIAKKMIDSMTSVTGSHLDISTLSLTTMQKDDEYIIAINFRPIVSIIASKSFRKTPIIEIFPGKKYPAPFFIDTPGDILIEVQNIIFILHEAIVSVYNPKAFPEKIEYYTQNFARLFDIFAEEYSLGVTQEKVGSADKKSRVKSGTKSQTKSQTKSGTKSRKLDPTMIKAPIVYTSTDYPMYLTNHTPDQLKKLLEKDPTFRGMTFIRQSGLDRDDFTLERCTFYDNQGNQFFHTYNALFSQSIPVRLLGRDSSDSRDSRDGLQVLEIAALRFMILDLISIISTTKLIPGLDTKLGYIIDRIKQDIVTIRSKVPSDPQELFGMIHDAMYVGTCIDQKILKRKLGQQQNMSATVYPLMTPNKYSGANDDFIRPEEFYI